MSLKVVLILAATFLGVIALWVGAFWIRRNDRSFRPVSSVSAATQPTADKQGHGATPAPLATAARPPKELAQEQLRMDYKWRKDGFGTVMVVDYSFDNRSAYSVKDISVTCRHFAESGTAIDSNTRTIYQTIPAKSKKTVRGFNMGFIHSQATSTICSIDDFEM